MSALHPRLPGARVVDLFAGSGALGLECLSRGAREAVFVEEARGALQALRANVEALGAGEEARVVASDVHRWLATQSVGAFDLALADPPYGTDHPHRLVERWLAHPFARELWIEHRTGETLPGIPRRDTGPDVGSPQGPGSGPGPDTGSAVTLRERRYGDTTLTTLTLEESP
jgi:16S rRNA (guanine966-N2)-methyltransferase